MKCSNKIAAETRASYHLIQKLQKENDSIVTKDEVTKQGRTL